MGLLPLSIAAFVSMWLLFFAALYFYDEGDDKRTLIMFALVVIDILAGFSMLIPTYTIVSSPAYNTLTYNVPLYCTLTAATCPTTTETTATPAYNVTYESPPFSNSVDTLYAVFTSFQAVIFLVFFLWSLRYRLQYKTFKQFEAEMRKNRRS
jgi:hypothetical protein